MLAETLTQFRKRHTRTERETLAFHEAERAFPWSIEDYEKLLSAVRAMVRTHSPDPSDPERSSVDGRSFWNVLTALDRGNVKDDDE